MESFPTINISDVNDYDVTYEQIKTRDDIDLIDLRSPAEYADGHIPGALSIPLFTDEERSLIGTEYKKLGPLRARFTAMEIVSPKIPAILKEIQMVLNSCRTPVVYCWRGGMRSQSVVLLAGLAGLQISRLAGGYRGYRQSILEMLPTMVPQTAVVIHGKTGTGKTILLDKLKEKQYPVIDLEAIANHKGSIFGCYGLGEPHNQKIFDSLFFEELHGIQSSSYFLVEAEGSRIGKVGIPDYLWQSPKQTINIMIHRSMKYRVDCIYHDYVKDLQSQPWFQQTTAGILAKLSKRIGDPFIVQKLNRAFEQEDYPTLIQLLCEEYYDDRYEYKEAQYEGVSHHIESDDDEVVIAEIEKILRDNELS